MDDSSDSRTTREESCMDQELCLVWLYWVIDGTLRSMIGTGRLRRRGPEPDLTDAEVLTVQIWTSTMDKPRSFGLSARQMAYRACRRRRRGRTGCGPWRSR